MKEEKKDASKYHKELKNVQKFSSQKFESEKICVPPTPQIWIA